MLSPKLSLVFIYCCCGKYSLKDIKRFISKIDIIHDVLSNCWKWTSSLDKDGYGLITIYKNNKAHNVRSHRASYEMFTGKLIPKRMVICHTCDNPKCVNPNHLFLGTQKDNIRDKVNKGRQPRGDKNYNAKLSWDIVGEIRYKYNNNVNTIEELSKLYKSNISDVSLIISNQIWIDKYYIRIKFRDGNSKINQQIANEIRKLRKIYGYTQQQLADMFKINRANVGYILRNKTWIDNN